MLARHRSIAQQLRRFKLITFDVTDTLLAFRRPPELEYARAVQHLGYGPIDADAMRVQFLTMFRELSDRAPNFGRNGRPQLTWENWWRQLIGGVLRPVRTDLDDRAVRHIADYLIDLYETDECWCKTHGADELLTAIRDATAERHVGQGIISNFDPRLKWLIGNVGLPPFDFVLASYEVGALKPNAEIFDLALKMYGRPIEPDQALHVGNTPRLDYTGARAAGWSSVLVTNGADLDDAQLAEVNKQHVFESLVAFRERLECDEEIDWQ